VVNAMKRNLSVVFLAGILATGGHEPAAASGLHLGYCNGVGNPHHDSGCPGTVTVTLPEMPTTTPSTNSGSGGNTGPQLVDPGNTLPPTGGGNMPDPVILVLPNPPTVIGGYSPAQPIIGQTGGFIGGQSPVPQPVPTPQPYLVPPQPQAVIVVPNAPETITGYGRAPVIIGTRGEIIGGQGAIPTPVPTPVPYPVPTATPYPVPVNQPQLVPQRQTIVIVPNPPESFTGYGRPPVITGTRGEIIGGRGAVPTPTPYPVPYPRPTPIPTAVAGQIPSLIPIPIQRPSGGQTTNTVTVVHSKTKDKPGDAHKHVTRQPGRQQAHAIPRFSDPDRGGTVDCVASGFHRRLHNGKPAGVLAHVELPDAMERDVPAEKPLHAGCLVKIKRKVTR